MSGVPQMRQLEPSSEEAAGRDRGNGLPAPFLSELPSHLHIGSDGYRRDTDPPDVGGDPRVEGMNGVNGVNGVVEVQMSAEDFFLERAIKDGYIGKGRPGLSAWYKDHGMLSPDALRYVASRELTGLLNVTDSPE